ncbi:hypothetical protein [Halobacillus sp. BBL2006]|uniref:hypothetical protein n=1 Tax=Halobacillus sp. BBL2006 TaxID=1543706 RepID=UPI000542F23C|nr:hypothetical protein [Halobacillus sp. BBL2006]KHE70699.1 hypothetical protein LD39_11280 [Halobacillus sp. BBL2006]
MRKTLVEAANLAERKERVEQDLKRVKTSTRSGQFNIELIHFGGVSAECNILPSNELHHTARYLMINALEAELSKITTELNKMVTVHSEEEETK